MTPSSCPWRTLALGPNPAGSPASGRCTSSAGPGSRWLTRTSSPGRATRDSGRTSIRSWSFSTISNTTQRSYNACCSWTQHPLIQKNRRVVLASFVLLLLGLVLILIGVGLEVAPSPGVSSAIFFVPGFFLLVPGVYHVIFIYCAVKGHRGFQFFYLPYFEK
ncbi:transmembrane protein 134 isoform X2 [Pteropus medius]|uniref:Transmembrane protein 134 isoform X2 n=1 Tax=Pteropus vampyrus TaxID=132908 RepID=A0A6P3RUP9_PTEVA|nr:transmembrane protein 134 isoform X2 [Pteropus vampyrus]XP_039696641.1 transmembrane protein 134 isoform X2 [Pteropus giganteus]